ncbi:hypothetical protein KR067_006198, partial [Drosophila pandora]
AKRYVKCKYIHNEYIYQVQELQVNPSVEFRNVNCQSLDKDFSDIEYCFLKSVNRTYKYFSLKVNLFQVPVTKVKVNIALYKRFNGYKPFLYNLTVDGCKFVNNPKANPVALFFFNLFKEVSNMNHSCPYNHDVIVEKLTSDIMFNSFSKILPFPDGDYLIKSYWFGNGKNRAVVEVYFSMM